MRDWLSGVSYTRDHVKHLHKERGLRSGESGPASEVRMLFDTSLKGSVTSAWIAAYH